VNIVGQKKKGKIRGGLGQKKDKKDQTRRKFSVLKSEELIRRCKLEKMEGK